MREPCFIALAASLLALAGCRGLDLAASAPPRLSGPKGFPIAVTGAAVGSLNAAVPFERRAIQAALPGFQLKDIRAYAQGAEKPALGAFENGVQVLQIFPDASKRRIGEIHAVRETVTGPTGERVGGSFAEAGARLSCRPGSGEYRGLVLCSSAAAPNVALIYSVPDYQGLDGRLPPADRLAKAVLQQIVWQPQA